MNMPKSLPAWCRHLAAGSLILAGLQTASLAQTTRPSAEQAPAGTETPAARSPGRQTGVVTGDRVNVRSGSDQNYYPVTQLNMGDQVVVVGEEHGWLEILPPRGTYSLIEKTYVTTTADDAGQGTVNESVWVKAGGEMSTRRYAKQVKLGRGAKVTILGETEDGDFHKITPPNGATLWVSGDFVDLDGGTAVAAGPSSPTLEPVKPGELLAPDKGAAGRTTTREATSIVTRTTDGTTRTETIERTRSRTPAPTAFQSQHQIEIKALEAEIAAESTKPLQDQNYDSILERLDRLAAQDDEVTRNYAQSRLKQIRSHIDLINTLNRVEQLTTSAIERANERQRERSSIQADEAISLDNIVVQGEIEPSSIYRGAGNQPRRWRIVERPDPSDKIRDAQTIAPKTLAYLEVPEDSTIDPMKYVGKKVGIVASKRRYIRDAIPPIPIYTVAEIVVVDQSGRRDAPSTRPAGSGASEPEAPGRSNRAVVASPPSARVAPPASQPAGAMKSVTTDERDRDNRD